MLPPKRQNLFPPFATTFDGDPAECSKHLGRARGMLSLMCRSMPPVKSRTETTADGVEIRVTTNPHHVYIKSGSTLFCTSFNEGDLGTQIYKKPYPPVTRDGLILDSDNPNKLVLPSPTYSARANYWANTRENATVSWDYVEYLDIFYPVGHASRLRKYGKIAVNGIETDLLWGKFLEPLVCALIDKDADDLPVQRIVIIYVDRLNYAGTGNNRYIAVYDYQIDTSVSLTEISKTNFNVLGYSTNTLIGFFGDAKRLAIYSTVDRIYYPSDYPLGITKHVPTINVIDFNSAFVMVVNDEIIYEESPEVSLGYNYVSSGETTTLVIPFEHISSAFIDVRGEYISFSASKTIIKITILAAEVSWEGGIYRPYNSDSSTVEHHLVSWSKKDTLQRLLLKATSSSHSGTTTESGGRLLKTGIYLEKYIYCSLFLKKQNECIYAEHTQSGTSSSVEGTKPAGDWGIISSESTQRNQVEIISKNLGELYTSDLTLGGDGWVGDYSYTKSTLVVSIYAFDYDTEGNETDKSFTLVSNMKSKYKIIPTEAKNISLTKFP